MAPASGQVKRESRQGARAEGLSAPDRCPSVPAEGTNVKVNSLCPGWVRTELGGATATRGWRSGLVARHSGRGTRYTSATYSGSNIRSRTNSSRSAGRGTVASPAA